MAQSVLANLEGRTTTEAATAPAPAGLKTGNVLTGQFLYDRLIGDNKEQTSLTDMVRSWVTTVDVASVKKALKDFVEIAKDKGDAALNTARTHRSNLQTIYGAMRFAPKELESEGFKPSTGYLVAKQIARKALADKSIKWDGTKIDSADIKEQKKHTKQSLDAQTAVMNENPQMMTENFTQWQERLRPLIEARIANMQQAKIDEQVTALANALFDKHPDLIRPLANELVQRLMNMDNAEEQTDDAEQE